MKAADHMEFVLSEENMEKLSKIKAQLEEMDRELSEYISGLRTSIVSLWNRLEVESKVQEAFMESCTGPKPEIAEKFQNELDRLEELKKLHMKRFIEATRHELAEVWDMCYFGPQQRQQFAPFFTDVYDENTLGEHESELDRMKGFYRDHIDLLKLITKREDLWKKMLEAEARANDPNRFYQNRGGQLLKEEKMRKKVEKDLPKVSKVCRSCPVCGGSVCVHYTYVCMRTFVLSQGHLFFALLYRWSLICVKCCRNGKRTTTVYLRSTMLATLIPWMHSGRTSERKRISRKP
jgi:protein regulator of cytokinesis 1